MHLHMHIHLHLGCAALGVSSTHVPGISASSWLHCGIVRHAGWVFSMIMAAALSMHGPYWSSSVLPMVWLVAAEAVTSDVLLWRKGDTFFCGNFGLMLLDALASPQAKELLSTMLRVTMMRGAQSAGLVTYTGSADQKGVRHRVVNGKRTDLCDLLMAKFKSQTRPSAICAPALFQGHTRFATSSIANFAGCHPHQWMPPRRVAVWRREGGSYEGTYRMLEVNHECFITHNGDLDFFEWHGTVYPLDDVFALLERFLGVKKPAPVDSAGVAGLLDLLRAKGMWHAAVRYGYVFGGLASAGNLIAQMSHLWSAATLATLTHAFIMLSSLLALAVPT